VRATDLTFIDYRFPILYLLYIVVAFAVFTRSIVKKADPAMKWLLIFFIFSYMAWQLSVSNMRYLVTLELIAPLIIYLLVNYLTTTEITKWFILIALLSFIVVKMRPIHIERLQGFGESYFNVTLPSDLSLPAEGMVMTTVVNFSAFPGDLLIYPVNSGINLDVNHAHTGVDTVASIQNYLVPFFPPAWHFVGVTGVYNQYAISPTAKSMIETFKGPVFLLTTQANVASFIQLAKMLGLSTEEKNCRVVTSDRMRLHFMRDQKILLCPGVKSGHRTS